MRLPALISLCILIFAPASAVSAQSAEGDIVRLPGNGAAKVTLPGERPARYVPGGGLLLSFDLNEDGTVTQAERAQGTATAFEAADANGDGALSALEQQAWAEQLPTRDDSLANPVRFDPNLDRMVSEAEFAQVVTTIASAYVDPASGNISITDLEAPQLERRERRLNGAELRPTPRANF
ncbi:MAG: EF-hand domain-containing protein [Pseudomonadota bacterium]